MFGLLIAGAIVDRLGFRKTMIAALCVVPCLIFVQFFANSLAQLGAAQVLMGKAAPLADALPRVLALTHLLGVPLGLFQTVTCVYAVEILPVCLRAYLTSYVSGCWVFGQLISAGVLRGTLHLNAPWAYRVPFATQ